MCLDDLTLQGDCSDRRCSIRKRRKRKDKELKYQKKSVAGGWFVNVQEFSQVDRNGGSEFVQYS